MLGKFVSHLRDLALTTALSAPRYGGGRQRDWHKFFAKQDAADVREWGEALKRLGYIK